MTLSTSVFRKRKADPFLKGWAAVSLFCAVFAAVYELFSHGVVSYAMVFMFLYPLLLGLLPCLILKKLGMEMPGRLWQDGVLTLTCGSLITGVIEIFGTEASCSSLFMKAGIILLGLGALSYAAGCYLNRKKLTGN